MRVALPLIGEDIAPRFCSADHVLVADLEAGAVTTRQVVGVSSVGLPKRLSLLADLGVGWLVCGGFNRRFLPMASAMGIRVTWGLWGSAEAALKTLSMGGTPQPPARQGPGRRRGHRRGRGRDTTRRGGRDA
ncbi:MAG: NifB/NifX family molybdenum-iron cluster-binding protein [Deltaproteobacteria bacterium]|nr:NifB/NifX family molybdenum-iron cluster-binding protein [Deltaproteobacteria bacterium]